LDLSTSPFWDEKDIRDRTKKLADIAVKNLENQLKSI